MHAAHTCTRTRALNVTLRVHVSAPFGCGLTSRGAKRTVRYEKEKTNRAMRMHLRCIRLNLTSFGPLHGPLRLRSAPRLRAPFGRKKKKKTASWSNGATVMATCEHAPERINRAMTLTPSPFPTHVRT